MFLINFERKRVLRLQFLRQSAFLNSTLLERSDDLSNKGSSKHLYNALIDSIASDAVYYVTSVISRWPVHLSMFSWILSINTPHNILSKPLAVFFPQDHCRNNGQQWERNEPYCNDYHQFSERIFPKPRDRTSNLLFSSPVWLIISIYLSSLPVAHLSDAPRRRLVVTGDSARIQDEITENSAWFFNVLGV